MSDARQATARTLSRDALIADPEEYENQRSAARERMIPLRAVRRVRVGEQLVLEFENAETLQYQVQEMIYAEGLTDETDIANEIAAYSRMLPMSHELSATVFVKLDGLQHAVSIRIGDEVVQCRELPGPNKDSGSELTYSVRFSRFAFTDDQRDAFRDPRVPASVVVDHPRCRAEVAITEETRKSLIADLALGA